MPVPNPRPRREDLPYRPCVGIMLLNRDGLAFVGKRIDQTVEGWQMPQGGIDEGETPAQAGLRELAEEVGTGSAIILRQMDEWLQYDLPNHLLGVALHGRYRGQKQKWLAMRFTGKDSRYQHQNARTGICCLEMVARRHTAECHCAVQAGNLYQSNCSISRSRKARRRLKRKQPPSYSSMARSAAVGRSRSFQNLSRAPDMPCIGRHCVITIVV